ncbi:anti-sigma factor domain-containing protein [Methylorubrum extorquens]|uniref:anti-sigma factor n=1 Tax=Methylorubrum extorquens TaxID=408 RepID=UPI002238C4DE|nr:anti-sigma factor [Methylorubrum extorquens]UYW32653.1 anti-sigma factor [Methylorubrum extorquens]
MTARPEKETMALEYALGLLAGESLAQVERLEAEDSSFAALVTLWRERFSEFDLTASPVDAGSELWARIAASVERIETGRSSAQTRSARAPRLSASFLTSLWHSLPVWRAAGLSGAVATLSLAFAFALIPRPSPNPIYVAVLMTEAAAPAAIVNAYRDGHAELIPITPITVPEGKALQVWTLWDRERGPVSIGLLDRAHSVPLDIARLPQTGADQLFEISLEPKQGSSTGRPTGPILMKGTTHPAL